MQYFYRILLGLLIFFSSWWYGYIGFGAVEVQGEITAATPATAFIFINEIMVQPEGDEKEWIELYNSNEKEVVLSAYTLHDEVGVIAVASGTVGGQTYAVLELSKSVLNNTGDAVSLFFGETLVEKIAYGKTQQVVSTTIPVPGIGKTIAKKEDGTFEISSLPTKGKINVFSSEISTSTTTISTSTPATSSSSSVSVAQIAEEMSVPAGVVVINEFVSDPADEQEEFIELYNTGDSDIDLSGWYIEDASENKTLLQGIIPAKHFFVIEKPKGALNNNGDEIIVYHKNEKEIDRVTFGVYDDGNIEDNAPAARDPHSVARNIDGNNTKNNKNDFVMTASITKNASNSISVPLNQSEPETIEQIIEKKIIISEIFPNPKGTDTEKEFIEIKNISEAAIDIIGWKIGDSSKKRYTVPTLILLPKKYAVFFRKESGISLNNSGQELVRIFTETGALADSILFDSAGKEDESYARKSDGNFAWTVSLTPEQENSFVQKNNAPEIAVALPERIITGQKVVLDASDTADQDNDQLRFSWFVDQQKIGEGDVYEYTFVTSGKHSLLLTVADAAGNEVKKEMKLKIAENKELQEIEAALAGVTMPYETTVNISEIFPDPEGSDMTEEFIEIYNAGAYEIDLGGWYLDDAEGGSKAYKIPDGTIIAPKQYFVFDREVTHIALNNSEDRARLLFPDKILAEEVVMTDIVSGAAYIQQDGQWIWSSVTTPGETNQATPIILDTKKIKKETKDGKIFLHTKIEDLKDQDIGDAVMVQGVVTVKPGVFGANYFYLTDRAGIQIYANKKYLPRLEVGDVVEVSGALAEAKGERRITVKKKEDIRIIRPGTVPEVAKSDIATLTPDDAGRLLLVEGEIMDKKANYVFIDDGTDEIQVAFSRGIKAKETIKEGDIIRVAGIMRTKGEELLLMPRTADDIQKIGVVTSTVTEYVADNDAQKNIQPYLFITLLGIAGLGVLFFLKKNGKI